MTYLAEMADVSRVATGGLVAAVWQGILLASGVGLGLRMFPKTPAAVRFAIWLAVFVVVAALPVALWPHAASPAGDGGRGAWLTLDSRWTLVIAAAWAIASVVRAGTLVIAAIQVRTLWKRAKPVELRGLEGFCPVQRDGTAMNGVPGFLRAEGAGGHETKNSSGSRQARICTSDEVDRPTVIGFFSPKILIPTWLLKKLTANELEQIVLHETGHLGRADDWMNLFQKIALVVFPLNPALAWVERRLCFERELACDDRVLRTTQAPKAYAACLATLAEHRMGRRGLVLALGALGRESDLGQRVGRILRRGEMMRPVHARLVLGGAMLGLLGGAIGLERCPQVIGFASDSGQIFAVAAPENVMERSGYQSVVFRESVRPSVVAKGQTGPQRPKPWVAVDGYGKAEGVPLSKTKFVSSRTSATIKPKAKDRVEAGEVDVVARTIDPEEIPKHARQRVKLAADNSVQWVLTAWQGEDGSRLVLTMATSAKAKDRGGWHRVVNDSEPISYQVYPYAAVPVRGGWLVFQM